MSRPSYDASRRQQAAARSRTAILDAARSLFVRHGYAATTMGDVATRAGVAPATAAAAFGGKAGLLKQRADIAIVGDDGPIPVREREMAADVAAFTDPRRTTRAAGRIDHRDARAARWRCTTSWNRRPARTRGPRRATPPAGQASRGMAEFVALVDPASSRTDSTPNQPPTSGGR